MSDFEVFVANLTDRMWNVLEGAGAPWEKKLLNWKTKPGNHVKMDQPFGQFHVKGLNWPQSVRQCEIVLPSPGIITYIGNSRYDKYLFAYRPDLDENQTFKYHNKYEDMSRDRYLKWRQTWFINNYTYYQYVCSAIHTLLHNNDRFSEDIDDFIDEQLALMTSKIVLDD